MVGMPTLVIMHCLTLAMAQELVGGLHVVGLNKMFGARS
jgi:hypothetical protein